MLIIFSMDDLKQQNMNYDEYRDHFHRRMNLRETNLNIIGDDLVPRKKNAQFKVIQKFIGKLKIQNKNYQALLTELDSLNLSKYLEEISNIIASSINQKQIHFYVDVASKLNTEYEGFPPILIKDLTKYFNIAFESIDDNKFKLKTLLLYTTELFVCGFAFSYKEVIQMIKKSFKSGKNKKVDFPSETQNKLFLYYYSSTIFAPFLINFTEIFTRKTPKWVDKWKQQKKEIFKYPEALPSKMKDELTQFFNKYVTECYATVCETCEVIKEYQQGLMQNLKLQGRFNKDKQRNYNEIVCKYESAKKNTCVVIDSLGQELDKEKLNTEIVHPNKLIAMYIGNTDNTQIFQDQFQKEIYQSLPNLVKEENKEADDDQYKNFKERLENCKNVKDSNEIAQSFATINNKKHRKYLVKDVLEYRREYQLVTPYLCRIIAIIHINYKDIGDNVNEVLIPDFEKIKDASTNTFVVNDKKSRLLKYLCQFTKFKVIDPEKMMNCIEHLIDDLNGYNIELMVAVLENVGLFLRLTQKSSNRFTFLLSKFQNVIKKKSLPIFTTSQLINSINLVKPRKDAEKVIDITLNQVEMKAVQIMKMDIADKTEAIMKEVDILMKEKGGPEALRKAFISAISKYDFLGNYNYAYLLEELQYPELTNYIIDQTIHHINQCLNQSENQKLMIWSKFFAQLYKYKLIQRPMLYGTMEELMKQHSSQIPVINSICTILDACIDYLESRKINKKNQRFIFFVKFKQYIGRCKYIPMLQEFQIVDIFNAFEPDLNELTLGSLGEFLQLYDNKVKAEKQEILMAEELDKFLWKKDLRKKQVSKSEEDERINKQDKRVNQSQKNASIQEIKAFQKEMTVIIDTNIKDFSSRIAKSTFLEKKIEKKKEKKREGPFISVIGRKGNKFIKKDVHQREQL